jgi:hypothetical protein
VGVGEGLEEVGRAIFAGVLAEPLASVPDPWKEERLFIGMIFFPSSSHYLRHIYLVLTPLPLSSQKPAPSNRNINSREENSNRHSWFTPSLRTESLDRGCFLGTGGVSSVMSYPWSSCVPSLPFFFSFFQNTNKLFGMRCTSNPATLQII